MKKVVVIFLVLLSVSFVHSQQTSNGWYKIVKNIHPEGDDKWDYLSSDDQASRLYVSHGNIVQVVDEVKGEVIGQITGLNGVHGIAIAAGMKKGFISSGKDSSVTVFDTKTLKVITKITVTGKGPDAILFDPFSKKVFVNNGKTNNVTVINAETNKVEATIALEGKPEFSVSDGKGKVYMNIEDKNSIAVINSSTYKVENVWSLAPGEGPSGLAIDNEMHRLFSVCQNKLMVVADAGTGKIIMTLPIGDRTDGAAFDPGLRRAYSSNGDGTLTVVQEEKGDTFSILANVATQKGARTITVNTLTHHLYLPTASFEAQVGNERPKIVPSSFVILELVP